MANTETIIKAPVLNFSKVSAGAAGGVTVLSAAVVAFVELFKSDLATLIWPATVLMSVGIIAIVATMAVDEVVRYKMTMEKHRQRLVHLADTPVDGHAAREHAAVNRN